MSTSCMTLPNPANPPDGLLPTMASSHPSPSTPSYPSTDQSRISALPSECKIAIIDYLSARDVIHLRLASLAWREPCIRGLFNVPRSDGKIVERGVFSIRSYRDDMSRLQDVSGRPWLAKHVKHIEVFAGPYLQTFHEDLFERCLMNHGVWFEGRKREYCLTDLDIWCNVFIMQESFKRLGGVDSLSISSASWCPFHNITVCHDWSDLCWRVTNSGVDPNNRLYSNVFEAVLRGLQYPLRSVALHALPLELILSGNPSLTEAHYGHSVLSGLMKMAPSLKTLKISKITNYTRLTADAHESDWGSNIHSLLQAASNLQSLEMHFPGEQPSGAVSKKAFYEHTWPRLRSLRIINIVVDQETVYEFLHRHKKSLTHLGINRCIGTHASFPYTVFNGSARALFNRLKDFKLQKFEIIVKEEAEIYDENWISHSLNPGLDENWAAHGADPPETATLLEAYVFGKCDWPMITDRPPFIGKWYRVPKWQARIPGFSEEASPCVDEVDMMQSRTI